MTTTNQPSANHQPAKYGCFILLGLLFTILMAVLGAGLGYTSGVNLRLLRQIEQRRALAESYYQEGLRLLDAGDDALALAYFEYALSLDPQIPGLNASYQQAISRQELTAAITPTPADRAEAALFNLAVEQAHARQWADTLNTLDALREQDLSYRTIDVDGLYYIALRHQGVVEFSQAGNLEIALYLFHLASRFAPLDRAAAGYANWARIYLTAASYWELDWEQAARYFGMLFTAFPSLHDGGWSAARRYQVASENYGDQLMRARDFCAALMQYHNALDAGAGSSVREKYDLAYQKCYPPTHTPLPFTATPTPTEPIPENTATPPPPDTATPEPPSPTPEE